MANQECPLRLTCLNAGGCPETVIEFDTVDDYPSGLVDDYRFSSGSDGRGVFPDSLGMREYGNDVSNNWPLAICSAEGAQRDAAGNLLPTDVHRIDALTQAIHNNTWQSTLSDAADQFPDAPWAVAFRAEAKSTDQRQLLAREHIEPHRVIGASTGAVEHAPTPDTTSQNVFRRLVGRIVKW